MKKILYTAAVLLSLISLNSCQDFLEKEPVSTLSSNLFWQTSADVESARASMYSAFASTMSQKFIDWGEVRGEGYQGKASDPSKMLELMSDNIPDNSSSLEWTDLYKTINLANLIIKYVPQMTTVSAQATIGEAYLMRAMCYFYAVRVWGDVPYFGEAIEAYDVNNCLRERTAADQVLQNVLEDIATAQTYLPAPTSSVSRIYLNLGASYALELDVNAWLHNYSKVIDIYEKKIATLPSSAFSYKDFKATEISDEFINKWRSIVWDDSADKEVFFAVHYDKAVDGTENKFRNHFGYSGEWLEVTPETIAMFETGDIRLDGTFHYNEGGAYYYIEKFRSLGIDPNAGYSDQDLIMYRYSYMMLLYAEALVNQNKVSDAVNVLNKIRTRAGISALSTSISKTEAAAAVLKEMRLEMFGEGKYWFDLVRTGHNSDLADCPDNRILFPIYINHLLQNSKLVQNRY